MAGVRLCLRLRIIAPQCLYIDVLLFAASELVLDVTVSTVVMKYH